MRDNEDFEQEIDIQQEPTKAKSPTRLASFLPFLAMVTLIAFSFLPKLITVFPPLAMHAAAQIVAFLFPTLAFLIVHKSRGNPCALRLKPPKARLVPFTIFMSLAVALLSFFINYISTQIFGGALMQNTSYSLLESFGSSNSLLVWAVIALLPAAMEELFFRGVLLSSQEGAGQSTAIIVSALTFALIHATPTNFVGPLVVGLIFGYVTIATGTIWPAIIAHIVNNSAVLLLGGMLKRYAAFGIWPYFLLITASSLFVLVYLSARSFEKELSRGKVARLRGGGMLKGAVRAITTPGVLAIIALLIAKVLFNF